MGREIADSILLVSEVIHSMLKEKIRGMAIKLDVEKAYDRVVWQFLLCVLEKFRFPPQWIACIKFCISSVNLSLLVNGSVCGFFPATNGLRQSNPLSPSVFIIMAKVLGRLIQKKHLQGEWKGIRIHDQLNVITHSQFADDTVVFGEASFAESKCILETLD
ncbi:secreted RxLR effector protein 78-like [Cryptomeria japonica]|uniref:secreted RxLR effector protein 78-like n=1 Tax=Cryptomeria japonica TaxID=3369 RepID=UPI0027DA166F|nr:secreted RxLR effector protein 78-like [Cryptomeria japonica]